MACDADDHDARRMIVSCGVDEFPSGPWTEQLASRFADRMGAELVVANGSAAQHVAAVEPGGEGVLVPATPRHAGWPPPCATPRVRSWCRRPASPRQTGMR